MMTISKRIPKEIADAQSEAMRASGIFYWADESDLRRGKAMIFGPEGTPYSHCPLVFTIQLPNDYPFSPPAVLFRTSDGYTRFHPNLYREGKVCLSILGTWSGPKWSAVMSLSVVLSSIQSLLDANPITNEPGWEKYTLEDVRAKGYRDFVEARIIGLSVRDLLRWRRGETPPLWEEFTDVLAERGEASLKYLKARIHEELIAGPEKNFVGLAYGLQGATEWETLLKMIKEADADADADAAAAAAATAASTQQ